MQTRRGFIAAMAAVFPAVASGCAPAAELPKIATSLEEAVAKLKAAELVREAGIFLFERRCWEVWREVDGRQYGMGCGSYFRWIHPYSSVCPFCTRHHPMTLVEPGELPDMFPLTLNFTGRPGHLNEFESHIWHLPDNDRVNG